MTRRTSLLNELSRFTIISNKLQSVSSLSENESSYTVFSSSNKKTINIDNMRLTGSKFLPKLDLM